MFKLNNMFDNTDKINHNRIYKEKKLHFIMEYKIKESGYKSISLGTIGIAQKIPSEYKFREESETGDETSKLVFLTKNEVMPCGHNQY